ncbi:hypothetical protein D9M70_648320 [compost metagenome]
MHPRRTSPCTNGLDELGCIINRIENIIIEREVIPVLDPQQAAKFAGITQIVVFSG